MRARPEAGEVLVFSGGLTEPVTLRRGGSVAAEFDGLGAIELSVQ